MSILKKGVSHKENNEEKNKHASMNHKRSEEHLSTDVLNNTDDSKFTSKYVLIYIYIYISTFWQLFTTAL